MAEVDPFGSGIQWPARVTPAGDLALVSGTDAIWQAIDILLRNPEPPPLDPRFSVDLDAYSPVRDAYAIADQIARAIQRNETRIDTLRVVAASYSPEHKILSIRISITPIGAATSETRTFPLWTHALSHRA